MVALALLGFKKWMNSTIKDFNCQVKRNNTIIKIRTNSLDFSSNFGDTIPYPQKHNMALGNYIYYFVVDGFFDTKNNNVY